MSALELVQNQIDQIESRVEQLNARKTELLMQSVDIFAEDTQTVTLELSAIETKLSHVPKQLETLRAQRDSLQLEELTQQVEPLYSELREEYDRQKDFYKHLYLYESYLKYARSMSAELQNQKLPGIRNRIHSLFKLMRMRGLSEAVSDSLKAREPVCNSFKGMTSIEKRDIEAHARQLFHQTWGATSQQTPVPVLPRADMLPEGFYPKPQYFTPDVNQSQQEAANARELQAMLTAERQRLGNVLEKFQ